MFDNIVVAVDSSDTSEQALQEAIKLAEDQQAKLHIIHVADEQFVDYSGLGVDYKDYEASIKKTGQKILNEAAAKARQSHIEFDTHLVELKLSEGRIEQKIVEAAKSAQADLLILGTHGRRGFNHLLLGSVAEGIVRISPIPALLIRGKQPHIINE